MSNGKTMSDPDIDLSSDLNSFFYQVIDDAIEEKRVTATETAEYYLVALLEDYVKPDPSATRAFERPLTLLLHEALNAEETQRFDRLRMLGDGVLYTSGFFAEHLKNRGVELDYITGLGARAYEGAATVLRRGTFQDTPQSPDLFRELAENFHGFVNVLSNVADRLQANAAQSSAANALKLYERWLRTGSAPLAAALTQRGLIPVKAGGGLH
jgi:hypothetical protein